MKYAWIDGERKAYPLPAMCETLAVSVSGYRAWKRGGSPHRKRLTDAQLLALIKAIHQELKGAYGSPRMVREKKVPGPFSSTGLEITHFAKKGSRTLFFHARRMVLPRGLGALRGSAGILCAAAAKYQGLRPPRPWRMPYFVR